MPPIDKLACITFRGRAVLYARTADKELFYNPGGKREAGETDAQALAREIREEVSVELVPETIEYLNTFTAQAHGKPVGTNVEIKCYTAQYTGDMKPAGEIEELAWFTSADRDRTSVTGQLILDWLKSQDLID